MVHVGVTILTRRPRTRSHELFIVYEWLDKEGDIDADYTIFQQGRYKKNESRAALDLSAIVRRWRF